MAMPQRLGSREQSLELGDFSGGCEHVTRPCATCGNQLMEDSEFCRRYAVMTHVVMAVRHNQLMEDSEFCRRCDACSTRSTRATHRWQSSRP